MTVTFCDCQLKMVLILQKTYIYYLLLNDDNEQGNQSFFFELYKHHRKLKSGYNLCI